MYQTIDFKSVEDIMIMISDVTTMEAWAILKEINYTGSFFIGSGSVCTNSMLKGMNKDVLASSVKDVAFRGGPYQDTWVTLTLQQLVEDKILEAVTLYGTRFIKETINDAFDKLYYGSCQ